MAQKGKGSKDKAVENAAADSPKKARKSTASKKKASPEGKKEAAECKSVKSSKDAESSMDAKCAKTVRVSVKKVSADIEAEPLKSVTIGSKISKKRIDDLTLLCMRGQELPSIGDLDVLLSRIIDTAVSITSAGAASVLLLDRSTNELYFRVASGEAGDKVKKIRFSADKGVAGWVIQNRQSVVVNDIAKDSRHFGDVDKTVKFQTKNMVAIPIKWEDTIIGVLEVMNKKSDFNDQDLEYLGILANQAGASIYVTSMVENLQNFFVNMLEVLMMGTETLASNKGHSVRVARLATKIAREMGVSEKEYKDIYYASLIHDVGQIKVARDKIVGGERLVPTLGAEMIHPIKLLKGIDDIVGAHHERWDGSGYPKGLYGNQIPLGARIIALAEEYEEWREEEAYRKQFDPYFQDDFFKHIVKTHDPRVVGAFKEVRRKEREKRMVSQKANQKFIEKVMDYQPISL